ncbi:MAG: FHA domain-containing protein [Anaerolineae bacterium]|nr:FHA domain-containing protein [Anaerolineae bacterium]
MSTETVLFLLRLASGLLLLSLLGVLLVVIWRDYRSASIELEATRRVHGKLVPLKEIDGAYMISGKAYPLLAHTSLGRAPTNSIPIDDTFASGDHALVALRSGQWWLEDRKSRNGTTLNEVPIRHPVIITDGDIIGIGNSRFRIELEQ